MLVCSATRGAAAAVGDATAAAWAWASDAKIRVRQANQQRADMENSGDNAMTKGIIAPYALGLHNVPSACGVMMKQIGRATSELQSLMRISYAVFCLKKKKH